MSDEHPVRVGSMKAAAVTVAEKPVDLVADSAKIAEAADWTVVPPEVDLIVSAEHSVRIGPMKAAVAVTVAEKPVGLVADSAKIAEAADWTVVP
ncbi:MAG: hypothetical protein ACLFTR_04810, partial [Candidatus Woesearchaeota archaeon]